MRLLVPRTSRRAFLRDLAAASLAFPFVSRLGGASANGLLQHASFGASGMAGADLGEIVGSKRARLVAVADVDANSLRAIAGRFPGLRTYADWRQLLEREAGQIDSVNVSTPDHMHAPIALAALQLGKHVYAEKPLAHNVFEVRQMTLQARQAKVATQMGIQIHSNTEYRTAVKLIQDLVIGPVTEVHSWSGKKWGDPDPLPDRADPVPEHLNWDLWLGVATPRPYLKDYYHPGNWRKRLDFGTGTFGDMGCHIYDPVFKALALTAPLTVRSEGPAPTAHNWAINALIHYTFPGTPSTGGKEVRVTWYDGDARPPQAVKERLGGDPLPDQGSLFIGTKGVMLLPHIGMPQLYPLDAFDDFKFERVPSDNHWHQWVRACHGEGQTLAGFDYAGPLTETVLIGALATRLPRQTLEWDAARLAFKNQPEANRYLRRVYRAGWEPKWVA